MKSLLKYTKKSNVILFSSTLVKSVFSPPKLTFLDILFRTCSLLLGGEI